MIIDFLKRIFCLGEYSLNRTLGGIRSAQWSKVRNDFIKGKVCEVCGTKKELEAHHISPFHLRPDLELLTENLMALCRPHHLLFGHLMSFIKFNNQTKKDAKIWKEKIENRI